MVKVSIYVGTYNKYNCGSLFGKWLDLSDYSTIEEFYEEIRKLHKDEEDPEFMFQDYECPDLFNQMGLISECHLSDNIYQVMEAIDNSCCDIDVIEAYSSAVGCHNEDIEDIIEKIEESYQGKYNSDCDFVQQLLEDCGDIPENLPSYIHIDWERTAYDIMMDYSTSDNHYFRNL